MVWLVGALTSLGVTVLHAPPAGAASKAVTCFAALLDVDARLAPAVRAAGADISYRVGPWDPAGTNLIVGPDYDAEVLPVAPGVIEIHLNCGTTRPVSRRQMRAAFRFLIVHEYTHILQHAYGFPDFDPEGERSADCAAEMLMRSWRWTLPSGVKGGSHGGCPDEMWHPTYAWLTSIGVHVRT